MHACCETSLALWIWILLRPPTLEIENVFKTAPICVFDKLIVQMRAV